MKKDYLHITFLIDRSGSMAGKVKDTIGGYNSFIKDQKKIDLPCTVSLVQFDDKYEVNYIGKDLKCVEDLNENTYKPRGGTALLDALYRSIEETGSWLSAKSEDERPEKVIFVVITDGEENSSKLYNKLNVKTAIQHQEDKYKWEFMFLGADINSVHEATTWGIKSANAAVYNLNDIGSTYSVMSDKFSASRCSGSVAGASMSFTTSERKNLNNSSKTTSVITATI
jgi:hypothetical protein